MDGENGDFEYGGSTKASEKSFSPKDEIKYWFSGFDAKKWLNKGYKKEELDVYMRPSFKEIMKKITRHFWSYYNFWDPQEHLFTHQNLQILSQTLTVDQRAHIRNMLL